jgi:hypothetical protein
MKPTVRIAILVPAGPHDDVFDTVESIVHYSDQSRVIVVIDDCGLLASGNADRLRSLSGDIAIIPPAAAPPGCFGGLWIKLCAGYRWLLDRYEPGLVLRMDADALMIGAGIEQQAEQAFADNPQAGLLGAYRLGPDDGLRDFTWPAGQVRSTVGVRGLLHPKRRSLVRSYYRLARDNGYTDGEHVLGGAYIHKYEAISTLRNNGWLTGGRELHSSTIGEDHMMGMVTMAAGFRMADFSGRSHPMALTWRGLPAHPADLLARGKLLTHSVRSWGDLREPEIRAIFAAARTNGQGSPR